MNTGAIESGNTNGIQRMYSVNNEENQQRRPEEVTAAAGLFDGGFNTASAEAGGWTI